MKNILTALFALAFVFPSAADAHTSGGGHYAGFKGFYIGSYNLHSAITMSPGPQTT